MVSEHNSQGKFTVMDIYKPRVWVVGFSSDLLSDTFSWSTFGNSVVAILSGMIANTLVDWTGSFVSPFMASAIFLVIGGVLVYFTWSENYGERNVSSFPSEMAYSEHTRHLLTRRLGSSILSKRAYTACEQVCVVLLFFGFF